MHHVQIVTGRAVPSDGRSQVFASVNRLVKSLADRLDLFLMEQGVKPNARVTVVRDGAGEFETTVRRSFIAKRRILNWFHIAMKFYASTQSATRFP